MNKKLLLSIGAIGAVIAPIAAVVACKIDETNDKSATPTTPDEGDKTPVEELSPIEQANKEIAVALQKDLEAVATFTLSAPTGWAKDAYTALNNAVDLRPELKIVNDGFEAKVVMKPGFNGSNAAGMKMYSETDNKEEFLNTSKYLYVTAKDILNNFIFEKNLVDHVEFKQLTGKHLIYSDVTTSGIKTLYDNPNDFITKVDGKYLWTQIPLINLKTAFAKITKDLNWQ